MEYCPWSISISLTEEGSLTECRAHWFCLIYLSSMPQGSHVSSSQVLWLQEVIRTAYLFKHGFWEADLWLSCWRGKYFIHWTISSACYIQIFYIMKSSKVSDSEQIVMKNLRLNKSAIFSLSPETTPWQSTWGNQTGCKSASPWAWVHTCTSILPLVESLHA